MEEKTISRETIFKGQVFEVTRDAVKLSNGEEVRREKVHHNGGVCVLALKADGTIPLVRQFRYGAGAELLELPAGKLEPGESPAECGLRELREECGVAAASAVSLGTIYPTPAYCGEVIHIFLAEEPFSDAPRDLDENELLSVEYVSFEEALDMAADGRIRDAKTVAGLFRAEKYLRK